ncbi:MAG: CRISPR-associated ring nuclease [Candidatus Xenobia bacterium]
MRIAIMSTSPQASPLMATLPVWLAADGHDVQVVLPPDMHLATAPAFRVVEALDGAEQTIWEVRGETQVDVCQASHPGLLLRTNAQMLPQLPWQLVPALLEGDLDTPHGADVWLWDRVWREATEIYHLVSGWLGGSRVDRAWLARQVRDGRRARVASPWSPGPLIQKIDWPVTPTAPQTAILQARGSEGPLDLRERVLVVTFGTSGGIVTETVDYLAHHGRPVHRVVALHTDSDKTLKQMEMLRVGLHVGEHIGTDAEEVPIHHRIPLVAWSLGFDDVRTEEDNWHVLTTALQVLEAERSNEVLLSIAGGRKTMGALGYVAGALSDVEHISHILSAREEPNIWHLPMPELTLVDLPVLPLHDVVQYIRKSLPAVTEATSARAQWEQIRAATRGFIERAITRDESLHADRERGIRFLQQLLKNPLLPPYLRVHGVRVDLAPVPVVFEERDCDVLLVGDADLASLRSLTDSWTPVVVLSEEDESSATARYFVQTALALAWLPRSAPRQLPAVLAGLWEEDTHFFPQTTLEGNCTEADAKLLQRLFAGDAARRIKATAFDKGLSSARKYWVRLDEQPRRYLVKIDRLDACLREYTNYRHHIRGFVDNSAGRLEHRPVRQGRWGAIAYTEVGRSHGDVQGLVRRMDTSTVTEVLKQIEHFHTSHAIDRQPVDLGFVRRHLNRLLPVRRRLRWAPGGDSVSGELIEVGEDKVQLVDDHGFRVTVVFTPEERKWLADPRLGFGRRVSLTGVEEDRTEAWLRRVLDDLVSSSERRLADQLLGNLDLDGFWDECLGETVEVGVIHGDLNLENVMLDRDAHGIWLIDFANTCEGPLLYDYVKMEVETWTHVVAKTLADFSLPTLQQAVASEGSEELRLIRRAAGQHSLRSPRVYDRLRAAYALNVLKFGAALDVMEVTDPQRRYAGRRIGLVLAANMMAGPVRP